MIMINYEFNELISENFTARLKQANLARKIGNSVKRQNLIIKKILYQMKTN